MQLHEAAVRVVDVIESKDGIVQLLVVLSSMMLGVPCELMGRFERGAVMDKKGGLGG